MVQLEELRLPRGAESAGGHAGEGDQRGDPGAEVRRVDHGDLRGGLPKELLEHLTTSGGAADQRDPSLHAALQVLRGRLGHGEVDHDGAGLGVEGRADLDADLCQPDEPARVQSEARSARAIDGALEHEVGALDDLPDDRGAHAAAGADHVDGDELRVTGHD